MSDVDRIAELLSRYGGAAAADREAMLRDHPTDAAGISAWFEARELLQRYYEEDPLEPTPPRQVGDFEIKRLIGRGGMGSVYEAEQGELQRRVALKILHPSVATTPRTRRRFEREARVTAQLHHTNIVTVHAMGRDGDHLYFAMELVDGEPLDRVLEHLRDTRADKLTDPALERLVSDLQGPGRFDRIARTFADVADALDVAHERGVIHRDVKPSNLILSEDGLLKLTDFGLARLMGEELAVTRTGESIGTPLYMSPEQVRPRDEHIDGRTDVYSLGATLYELLTLERMHAGEGIAGVCRDILDGEPRPIREIDAHVPRDLATIVGKATEKERADLYATAGALGRDLRAFAEGRSITARSVGPLGRQWRRVKRHKIRSSLVAVVLLLAIVGTALGLSLHAAHEAETSAQYDAFVRTGHESMARHGAYVPRGLFDPVDIHPIRDAALVIAAFDRAIQCRPERYEAYFGRALVRGRSIEDRLADVDAARARGLSAYTHRVFRGFLFADAGRHDEAEAEAAKARTLPREDDRTAFFEGKVLAIQHRHEEAIERYTQAIRNTTSADTLYHLAHYERGLVEEGRGNYAAALQDYARVFRDGAHDATLPIRIASLWRAIGQEEQAELIFQSAIDRARKQYGVDDWLLMWSACSQQHGRDGRWREVVSSAAFERFPQSATICAWRAVRLADDGKAGEAEAMLARAEALSPGDPEILECRGELHCHLQNWEAAERAFEQVLAADPENVAATRQLGVVLSRQLRFEVAAKVARRLVELRPYEAEAHANLAAMLINTRRYEEAERAVERGLALDPRDAMLYQVQVKLANWRRDFEAAYAAARMMCDLDPSATAWSVLAGALNNVGQYEEAEAAARRSIQADPSHDGGWFVLAYAVEACGRLEEALTAYRHASALRDARLPGNGSQENVARLLRLLGQTEDARLALAEAMKLKPRDDVVFRMRAYELRYARRYDEALSDLDGAIALRPSDPLYHLDRAKFLLEAGRNGDPLQALAEAESRGAAGYDFEWLRWVIHKRSGNSQEAALALTRTVEAARKDLEIAERAAAKDLQDTRLQRALMRAHLKVGDVLSERGDLDTALERFRDALTLAESLDANDPGNGRLQGELASIKVRAGRAELLVGARQPTDAGDHLTFGRALYGQGRFARSAEHFRTALVDKQIRADLGRGNLYDAACSAALAASKVGDEAAATWRQQALVWLREDFAQRLAALKAARAQDVEEKRKRTEAMWKSHMKHARVNDSDLAILRGTPEFDAIIKEMSAAGETESREPASVGK